MDGMLGHKMVPGEFNAKWGNPVMKFIEFLHLGGERHLFCPITQ